MLLRRLGLGLKQGRNDVMAIEQFVEIGTIPVRYAGCLGHIPVGGLKELDEILLLELPSGF